MGGERLHDEYCVVNIGSQDVDKFCVVEHPNTEKAEALSRQSEDKDLIEKKASFSMHSLRRLPRTLSLSVTNTSNI